MIAEGVGASSCHDLSARDASTNHPLYLSGKPKIGRTETCQRLIEFEETGKMRVGEDTQGSGHFKMAALSLCAACLLINQQLVGI
jgi:hypothetical protein